MIELPPLPDDNTLATLRRIRRCENEVAAQVVLEYALQAYARAAVQAAQPEAVALPRANSIEASAMIDSVLAGYNWPTNPKNAARAGFEACLKLLASAPTEPMSAPTAEPGFVILQTPITEEMHVAAVKVLHRASGLDGLPQRMLEAMLLAGRKP